MSSFCLFFTFCMGINIFCSFHIFFTIYLASSFFLLLCKKWFQRDMKVQQPQLQSFFGNDLDFSLYLVLFHLESNLLFSISSAAAALQISTSYCDIRVCHLDFYESTPWLIPILNWFHFVLLGSIQAGQHWIMLTRKIFFSFNLVGKMKPTLGDTIVWWISVWAIWVRGHPERTSQVRGEGGGQPYIPRWVWIAV